MNNMVVIYNMWDGDMKNMWDKVFMYKVPMYDMWDTGE